MQRRTFRKHRQDLDSRLRSRLRRTSTVSSRQQMMSSILSSPVIFEQRYLSSAFSIEDLVIKTTHPRIAVDAEAGTYEHPITKNFRESGHEDHCRSSNHHRRVKANTSSSHPICSTSDLSPAALNANPQTSSLCPASTLFELTHTLSPPSRCLLNLSPLSTCLSRTPPLNTSPTLPQTVPLQPGTTIDITNTVTTTLTGSKIARYPCPGANVTGSVKTANVSARGA